MPLARICHTRRPNLEKAFTLMEVLVVVGILGLLTTIAVVGFRVVGGASKSRLTGVAMENCKGLLAAYKETSSLDSLIDSGPGSILSKVTVNSGPMRWLTSDGTGNLPVANTTTLTNALAVVPGTKLPGDSSAAAETDPNTRTVRERYLRDETARVIKRLMAVPANRKAIEAMSTDRVAKVRVPADPTVVFPTAMDDYPTATAIFESVVLLDGNGKPLYFIPGGGLRGVDINYLGSGDKTDKTRFDRSNQTIRAKDHQPFWASPGPDGDLTTGDDNEYSTDVETK